MVKHVNITYYLPDPPSIWQLTKPLSTGKWDAPSHTGALQTPARTKASSLGIFFAVYLTPFQANSLKGRFPSTKSTFFVFPDQRTFLYCQWLMCQFNRKNIRIYLQLLHCTVFLFFTNEVRISPIPPYSYVVICIYTPRADKNITVPFVTVVCSNSPWWRAKGIEESSLVSFCSVFFHVFPPVPFLFSENRRDCKPTATVQSFVSHRPLENPIQINNKVWGYFAALTTAENV